MYRYGYRYLNRVRLQSKRHEESSITLGILIIALFLTTVFIVQLIKTL